MALTFEEFCGMPRSEQNIRYHELSDHDKFLARMSDWSSTAGKGSSSLADEERRRITTDELRAIFKDKDQ